MRNNEEWRKRFIILKFCKSLTQKYPRENSELSGVFVNLYINVRLYPGEQDIIAVFCCRTTSQQECSVTDKSLYISDISLSFNICT